MWLDTVGYYEVINKMSKCVICSKEDSKFTKEHIIPYGLGNRQFVIDCVCSGSNSKL